MAPERRLSAHKHPLAHVMPWTPCLSAKPTCPYWPQWICRTCSRSRSTRLGGWWRINMPAPGDATVRIGQGRILSSAMSQRRRGRQLAWPSRCRVSASTYYTWEEQGGQHVEGKSAPRRLTRPQQARRWNLRIQLSTHQQRLLYLAPANNAGPTKPTACRSPSRPWAKYLVVPNAKMLPYLDRRPLCFSLLSSVAQPEHGQT
jgi:hypothetical protein